MENPLQTATAGHWPANREKTPAHLGPVTSLLKPELCHRRKGRTTAMAQDSRLGSSAHPPLRPAFFRLSTTCSASSQRSLHPSKPPEAKHERLHKFRPREAFGSIFPFAVLGMNGLPWLIGPVRTCAESIGTTSSPLLLWSLSYAC